MAAQQVTYHYQLGERVVYRVTQHKRLYRIIDRLVSPGGLALYQLEGLVGTVSEAYIRRPDPGKSVVTFKYNHGQEVFFGTSSAVRTIVNRGLSNQTNAPLYRLSNREGWVREDQLKPLHWS